MLLVTFVAGEQAFGIASSGVLEVIPRVSLRPVPHAPEVVAGLFNYRGRVTPVVDLTRLLAGRRCPDRLSSRIIMVEIALADRARAVGLLAEGVTDVISPEAPAQAALALPDAPYLGGIVEHDGSMIQIVEPRELLDDDLHRLLIPDEEPAA